MQKASNRRRIIKGAFAAAGTWLIRVNSVHAASKDELKTYMMPDEGERHVRTWMSFVADKDIWANKQRSEVKNNLVLIAKTIANHEPVSVLVGQHDQAEAKALFGDLDAQNYAIELIPFATDDLWLRDTGPTFVRGGDGVNYGVNFNFNGWGGKQAHQNDAKVAEFITQAADAKIINTRITLEGGCFEVDGHGTAILTKSCILNDNRNPDFSQSEIEQELKHLLGLKKIIWLEGVKGKDITDGHTDFYARFFKQGKVFASLDNYAQSYDYRVTRENIDILKSSTDALGNRLNVRVLETPNYINETFGTKEFAAGYVGYYLCNGAVIMQSFGDAKADKRAKEILSQAFPNRVIEQLRIDAIASGGGSIHCATQQQPFI